MKDRNMSAIKETLQKPTEEAAKPETAADAPAKPQFNKEELLRIFDEIIFSSEYVEDVTIKGKLKVSFRTRSVKDTTEISRDVDGKNFTLMATLHEYRALQNLAYSLVKYNGKDLSKMSAEERTKFIDNLPAIITSTLSDALVKFDTKVAEACREGEANF